MKIRTAIILVALVEAVLLGFFIYKTLTNH
jgi:hypothetical protein